LPSAFFSTFIIAAPAWYPPVISTLPSPASTALGTGIEHCQFVYSHRIFPVSGSIPTTLPPLALSTRPAEAVIITTWLAPPTFTIAGLTYPTSPRDCVVHLTLPVSFSRSEEHTSELQSRQYLVCR